MTRQDFVNQCESLFDIKCTDTVRQKYQEKICKVKETDTERGFYEKQSVVPQVNTLFSSINKSYFFRTSVLEVISTVRWKGLK